MKTFLLVFEGTSIKDLVVKMIWSLVQVWLSLEQPEQVNQLVLVTLVMMGDNINSDNGNDDEWDINNNNLVIRLKIIVRTIFTTYFSLLLLGCCREKK